MKAVELNGFEGINSLRVVEVEKPKPGTNQVLLEVKADGISFAEATTIPVHGLSAYALLKFAAKPHPDESLLIQAAAGGVGLYLVQLAKTLGVKKVIALASSKEKTDLVRSLGADVAINYFDQNWTEQVREATGGKGVDVVLEAA